MNFTNNYLKKNGDVGWLDFSTYLQRSAKTHRKCWYGQSPRLHRWMREQAAVLSCDYILVRICRSWRYQESWRSCDCKDNANQWNYKI